MNRTIIGIVVILAAVALAVGAAFGVSRIASGTSLGSIFAPSQPYPGAGSNGFPGGYGPGMMGGGAYGPGMMGGYGRGMMGGRGYYNATPSGTRISLDQAVQDAQKYASSYYGAGLQIAEVMEFQDNFYLPVIEKDGGRGAFELLVDPYSGSVFPEYGPNMMWNLRYGPMSGGVAASQKNAVSLDEARSLAQKALDGQISGAKVEEDGFDFYGYYTFDYTVNGQIAGMLSINGSSGQAWLHTWHGQFITEKELTK